MKKMIMVFFVYFYLSVIIIKIKNLLTQETTMLK